MTPTQPSQVENSSSEPSWIGVLAGIFFRDKRLLVMVLALIFVAGLSSLAIMPRMEDPVLTARTALVVTRMPGATAERVESLVTEKIEASLRDVFEIDEISSVSRPGISTINVTLLDSIYEADAIWAKVRGKIEDSIALLPPEASRPVFDELNTRAYALLVGLTWDQPGPPDYRVLRRLAADLQDRLQNVTGTEVVDRFGDPGEEIEVRVDPIRAASMGLSPAMIAQRVANYDAKGTAGQLRDQPISMLIEVENQLDAVARISNIPIAAVDGKDVRLSEVSTVSLGVPSPLPVAANLDGREAVVLGALVRKDYRIDAWTQSVDKLLAEYELGLPQGIVLDRLLTQNDYVAERLDSLMWNLIYGAAGVAAVIFVMMGWRSAIIVTLALPLSSLMVLFGMRVYGIPIHQMSVTGIIIAFGLLIDNAIVVVDEVKGRLRKGKSAIEAMIGSVEHLAVPLLGSTLTTAFAFAPIALMPGGGGEFVGAIAISVIMAITASFVLSLTVLPTIAAMFVSRHSEGTNHEKRPNAWVRFVRDGISWPWLSRKYEWFLRACLRHPFIGVVSGVALPVVGFAVAGTLKEQFFPPTDRNQFHIEVDLPITAAIGETRKTAEQIDKFVRDAGAARVDWFYASSAPAFYYNVVGDRRGQPNYAQAIVTLEEGVQPKPILKQLQATLSANFVKPRILVRQLEQGPPFEAPVEIRVFGPDLQELRRLGDEVRQRLSNHPDVVAVRSDLSEVLPQLSFQVDEAIASSVGTTPAEIADQLATTLEGSRGGNVLQDNEELPVVVRVGANDRGSLARIEGLDLIVGGGNKNTSPRMIPLSALATVDLTIESASIPRLDRQRMSEVSVYLRSGVLPSTVQAFIEDSLASKPLQLQSGYSIGYGGEASERDDSIGNLLSTVSLLMVMMVATLVLSFGSFRMAAIIGFVGMLSTGLAMLSLAIGGYQFGFISIIGTMGLLGVAINDSIVILAGIRSNPRACAGDIDATTQEVMHASRHVLSTTITTIAGFAPLVVSGGEFWPPLAVAISGGVAGATVLAMVFVPSLHQWIIAGRESKPSVFLQLKQWIKNLLWHYKPLVSTNQV